MDGLRAWDEALFRWINRDAAPLWLDPVARFLSGNPLFAPVLVMVALGLVFKGGQRGWIFVLVLGLGAALANEFLAEPLKDWVRRPRPYTVLDDAILRVGRGNPVGSMPSAHAMNMALIATICCWFYPKAGMAVAAFAMGVGWSRVYNGAHYPSDVLAGFVLGAGFGMLVLVGCEWLWRGAVGRARPGWVERVPSLLHPRDFRKASRPGDPFT